jgi:hypothetical protein
VEKKKQPDFEPVQKAEVAYVVSMHKETTTLHSTTKKKDTNVAISQQKKPVAGVAHGNTHVVQIKDVKLEVEEDVVEQRVELQVHEKNDVEVKDDNGVKLLCTNQFTQNLKLIEKAGKIIYTLILPITCSPLVCKRGIGVYCNLFLLFNKSCLP